MITNWEEVAIRLGSIREGVFELGGDSFGQAAVADILGVEWIRATVDHSISWKNGNELAMSSLRIIHSEKAVHYCYQIYKSSDGERAERAVWLMKQLAHRVSYKWVEEFLNDQNALGWGLGLLDQLLWTSEIQYDEQVESLLQLALTNSNVLVAEKVAFIKGYLQDREDSNTK